MSDVTLESLKAQVKALEEKAATEAKLKDTAKVDAWNKFISSRPWIFKTTAKMYEPWMSSSRTDPRYEKQLTPIHYADNWTGPRGVEMPALYVLRLFDPVKLAAWEAIYGPALESNESTRRNYANVGMLYVRTDEGILTHDSGGHCVLRDPMLCSDEEWAQMCRGVIPDKYIL